MRRLPLGQPISPELQRVFDLLVEVSANVHAAATLRVAGGWVRDMVMGKDANDVDIAIETPAASPVLITGTLFASSVADYVTKNPQWASQVSSVHVFKMNPDKSKHIETAQIKVLGMELEFSQLRKDDYTGCDGHRIPVVLPGTPLEDAERRDFRCNALFYNLQERCVEDYVDGMSDITGRVLRCPLAPFETFMDDPLRMLRAVRFSAQLSFTLDGSICHALTAPSPVPDTLPYPYTVDVGPVPILAKALVCKVSRERAAVELTKMLSGPDPLTALCGLRDVGLLFAVVLVESYHDATQKKNEAPSITVPMVTDALLHAGLGAKMTAWMAALLDPARGYGRGFAVKSPERLAVALCAIVFPVLRDASCVSPTAPDPAARVEGFALRWMKLPMRIAETVARVVKAVEHLAAALPTLLEHAAAAPDARGMIFRGDARRAVFRALRAVKADDAALFHVATAAAVLWQLGEGADVAAATDTLLAAIAADSDGALLVSAQARPLVDGAGLARALGIKRQEIAAALDVEMDFMLHNPGCTADDVMRHLTAARAGAAGPPAPGPV